MSTQENHRTIAFFLAASVLHAATGILVIATTWAATTLYYYYDLELPAATEWATSRWYSATVLLFAALAWQAQMCPVRNGKYSRRAAICFAINSILLLPYPLAVLLQLMTPADLLA